MSSGIFGFSAMKGWFGSHSSSDESSAQTVDRLQTSAGLSRHDREVLSSVQRVKELNRTMGPKIDGSIKRMERNNQELESCVTQLEARARGYQETGIAFSSSLDGE